MTKKLTAAEVEQMLDWESTHTEASLIGYDDWTSKETRVTFDGALDELDEWFVEIVMRQLDRELVRECYDVEPDEPMDDEDFQGDIMVRVDIDPGPGGYLEPGSLTYRREAGDVVVAEDAYDTELDISLPTDDEEFMRVGSEAGLFELDEDLAPWMVTVYWTAYIPAPAMERYEIEQTETGVLLGVYEAETPEEAIRAMLADAGDDGEPDPGLVAHKLTGR